MSDWDIYEHTYGGKEESLENRKQKEQIGEKTNSAVKMYKEHPELIRDLTKELIDKRGDLDVANGKERYSNIKDGGAWNNEARSFVGPDGLPRDWAHLTGYLKKNPDKIADVLQELNRLKEDIENRQSNPDNPSNTEQVNTPAEGTTSSWASTMENGGRPLSNPDDLPNIRQADEATRGTTSSWTSTMENGGRPLSNPNDLPNIRQQSADEDNEPPLTAAKITDADGNVIIRYDTDSRDNGGRPSVIYVPPTPVLPPAPDDDTDPADNGGRPSVIYVPPTPALPPAPDDGADGDSVDIDIDIDTPDNDNPDNPEEDMIGDIELKLDEVEAKFDEAKDERIKLLEKDINKLRPELAELYAKNRRFFVGSKIRGEFNRVKREYSRLLDEYLSLKTEESYSKRHNAVKITDEQADKARNDVREALQGFIDSHPDATQEEIDAEKVRLQNAKSRELCRTNEIRQGVNADFLDNYLEQQRQLEKETIDKIDNGTIFRKAVSKIINNRYLKGALAVAGTAGLLATGIGIAAGAVSVGLAYTAGGVAMGAGRGALSGLLMSRQDSKNSSVRGFMNEADRRAQLEKLRISKDENGNVNVNISNVADYLVGQYSKSSDIDHSSNRRRTMISTGIGAIIGGAMSGVQLGNKITRKTGSHEEKTWERTTGIRERTETKPDIDIDSISHKKGTGIEKLYYEMGGTENFYQSGAYDVFLDAGRNNGLTVGKAGWTFPGKIGSWNSERAKNMVYDAAEELAKRGLLPAKNVSVGVMEPAYTLVTKTVEDVTEEIVRNKIFDTMAQVTATAGAGVIGGAIGSRRNASPESDISRNPSRSTENIDRLFEVENEANEAENENNPESASIEEVKDGLSIAERNRNMAETRRNNDLRRIDNQIGQNNERIRNNNEEVKRAMIDQYGISDELADVLIDERDEDSEEQRNRYQAIWDGLDDATKNVVRQLSERTGQDDPRGRGFRRFLSGLTASNGEATQVS